MERLGGFSMVLSKFHASNLWTGWEKDGRIETRRDPCKHIRFSSFKKDKTKRNYFGYLSKFYNVFW